MKAALTLTSGRRASRQCRAGGVAERALLTGGPGGGGQGGGGSAMAGAAGLTAEVSWKVLERRARTKRSGLAGWGAAPLPEYLGWCFSSSTLVGGRRGPWE